MKKSLILLFAVILSFTVFQIEGSAAKTKNSPRKNYTIFINQPTPYYLKTNGKKLGAIPDGFTNKKGVYTPNVLKVTCYVNTKWAKVHFSKTLNGKKSTAYIPTKYIRANTFSLDYGITKSTKTALKTGITTKSKTIKTISHGTRVSIMKVRTQGMKTFYYVTYYKNGKSYKGYITEKSIQL